MSSIFGKGNVGEIIIEVIDIIFLDGSVIFSCVNKGVIGDSGEI